MSQANLEAPTLLVSMPQVQDPFFHRSVVLLVSHNEEGSLGFVVNRTTDLLIAKVLGEMDVSWQGPAKQTALLGGPVRTQLGTVLLPSPPSSPGDETTTLEIAPGISITQDLAVLQSLAQAPPLGLRLILGHAGWSRGQLDLEIQRHDWLVCPADAELVLHHSPDSLWDVSLQRLGIKPEDLPEWISADEIVN